MITPVSLWLLTAHLVGDFPLQPDWIANHKTEQNTRLGIHVCVHGFLNIPIAWVVFADTASQLAFLSWIVLTHALIDSRRWVEPKDGWGDTWVWLNDQIFHLISLSLATPVTLLGPWG